MKKFEIIGAIEVILHVETLRNDLISYDKETNIATTNNKEAFVEYCKGIDGIKNYEFIFIELDTPNFQVDFEYINDSGDWEKTSNKCETLREARFKVNAINNRYDMRNPIVKRIIKSAELSHK